MMNYLWMRKQPYHFKSMRADRELISGQNPGNNAWIELLEGTQNNKWRLHSK